MYGSLAIIMEHLISKEIWYNKPKVNETQEEEIMNKKEKIAAYVEAQQKAFKSYEVLSNIFNENVLGELKEIYEQLRRILN